MIIWGWLLVAAGHPVCKQRLGDLVAANSTRVPKRLFDGVGQRIGSGFPQAWAAGPTGMAQSPSRTIESGGPAATAVAGGWIGMWIHRPCRKPGLAVEHVPAFQTSTTSCHSRVRGLQVACDTGTSAPRPGHTPTGCGNAGLPHTMHLSGVAASQPGVVSSHLHGNGS